MDTTPDRQAPSSDESGPFEATGAKSRTEVRLPAPPAESFKDRRKVTRYEVSAKVTITIFAQLKLGSDPRSEAERVKLVREGFSVDVSSHGLCMVIDGKPTGIALQQLIGQTAKVKLDLNRPGKPELNILGRIAWAKEDTSNTKVGIQFTDVPPEENEILLAHCTQDEGEFDQLSTLWELLVAQPKNS